MELDGVTGSLLGLLLKYKTVVFGGAVVLSLTYYIAHAFLGSKKSPSPIGSEYVRSPEPIVTDKKERKAVLKPVFKAGQVTGQQYDVVVIGSGMGGLGAAVLLARAGRKVLVLEQHGRIGGCCHTFGTGGVEFDTGIHYLGAMQEDNLIYLMTQQLTEGQVEMAPMESAYDVAVFEDGDQVRRYPMEKGKENLKAMFLKNFPGEEKAIEKYFELLKAVEACDFMSIVIKSLPLWLCRLLIFTGLINVITQYFRLAGQSVQQVLDSLTDNQQLKAAICYILGDAGITPEDCSFALHAGLVNHYMNGAFYPNGGPSEIPFHMVKIIRKYGGEVYGKACVSKILLDSSGHVAGVSVRGKEGGEVEIPTKAVVSDAGLMNTLFSLLPAEVAQNTTVWPLLKTLKRSISCISLFVTLEGDMEDLGIKANNTWVYTDTDINKSTRNFFTQSQEDVGDNGVPFFFISFPSCKDPTWKDRYPGKSSCVVITLSKWEWFEEWQHQKVGKREDRYKDLKTTIGRRMWEQVLRHFPQLDGKMLGMDVGTPLSNKHYLAQAEGEMYGLDHGLHRYTPEVTAKLRPDIGVPGLYMSGQDVVSCGFPSVMFAGIICAATILKRNLTVDLINLQKEAKARLVKVQQ